MIKKYTWFLPLLMLLSQCTKEAAPPQYNPVLPDYFPKPTYDFAANPISTEGFELGRALFYDPILSLDSTISCGSCHQQSAGFTQHGHDISHGINDRLGTRNALPIMNLVWAKSFFWDGGVHQLAFSSIPAITSPVEMDETLEHVVAKLNRHARYPQRFQKAFGSTSVTSTQMLQALAQFMAAAVSTNSRYDQFRQGRVVLTADERAGLQLVETKCGHCHSTALFTDYSFRNNGLETTNDKGRYGASLIETDKYKFRVPSLRNLTYTAPYMHDGRLRSIDAVLDHYSDGVRLSPTLDSVLQQNGRLGISLTPAEKAQIKVFLQTLDDPDFIRDKRFAEQ